MPKCGTLGKGNTQIVNQPQSAILNAHDIPNTWHISSRQMADFTGASHTRICRLLEKFLFDLRADSIPGDVASTAAYQRDWTNSRGIPYKEYVVPLDIAVSFLASRNLSVSLRRDVVRRWLELEGFTATKLEETTDVPW